MPGTAQCFGCGARVAASKRSKSESTRPPRAARSGLVVGLSRRRFVRPDEFFAGTSTQLGQATRTVREHLQPALRLLAAALPGVGQALGGRYVRAIAFCFAVVGTVIVTYGLKEHWLGPRVGLLVFGISFVAILDTAFAHGTLRQTTARLRGGEVRPLLASLCIFVVAVNLAGFAVAPSLTRLEGNLGTRFSRGTFLFMTPGDDRPPRRGDLLRVAVEHKTHAGWTQRFTSFAPVVGLPGDSIEWRESEFFVNGRALDDRIAELLLRTRWTRSGSARLGPDQFALGLIVRYGYEEQWLAVFEVADIQARASAFLDLPFAMGFMPGFPP